MSVDGGVYFVSNTVLPERLRAFFTNDTRDSVEIIGIPYRYK